jgi:hypothetical protein
VFFDATAEYCRSDESSDPCAVPVSVGVCAGQSTERFRGQLRIRLSGLHPRVGPEARAAHREQARDKTPEGAGSLNTSHSRVGPVLGLGPMSSHLAVGDSRASCVELRRPAGKPVRRRVLRLGSPLARRLVPGALRGFLLLGSLAGCPPASGRQRDRRPFAEVTRRLPHAGCPPKWVPRRKTRSGNTMTPPMGFVSFRRGKHR